MLKQKDLQHTFPILPELKKACSTFTNKQTEQEMNSIFIKILTFKNASY